MTSPHPLDALDGAAPSGVRPRIVSVISAKGGVGKTRVAIEINHVLRGLLLDLDGTHSGNATRRFGIKHDSDPTIVPAVVKALDDLERGIERPPAFAKGGWRKPWQRPIVPAHRNLTTSVIRTDELADAIEIWAHEWGKATEPDGSPSYPYIVIDTPPGRNDLSDAAIPIADALIVPVELETDSLTALQGLLPEITAPGFEPLIVPSNWPTKPNKLQGRYLRKILAPYPQVRITPVIHHDAQICNRRSIHPVTHDPARGKSLDRAAGEFKAVAAAIQDYIDSRTAPVGVRAAA